MKFFAYALLVGVASTLNLDQVRPASEELVQMTREKDEKKNEELYEVSKKGEYINLLAKMSGRLILNKDKFLDEKDVFHVFAPGEYQIAHDLFDKAEVDKDGRLSHEVLIGRLFHVVS